MVANLHNLLQLLQVKQLAAYYPMSREIDILTDLLHHSYEVCLPVIIQKDTPLKFAKYSAELEPSSIFKNVLEPKLKQF